MIPIRHLLVRGVNWLGDAVQIRPRCAPARALPARITIHTAAKLADLWTIIPVDAISPSSPAIT
jgi:hypothetical protein